MGNRVTLPGLRKTRGRKLKILIVRPDRIGDVVLSTPVLAAIKSTYPESEIHMLVRDFVVPVVRHNPAISRVITYRPQSLHFGLMGFFRLWRQIFREKYDVALTLQVQAKPSLAVFLAGIRFRIGPYSKWYSWLLFNRGKRQRRSAVGMHEADYNLMLLRKLGLRVPTRKYDPHITVDADAKERMRKHLRSMGIDDHSAFVIVHPGMGGSALNWPEGYYSDLIQRLGMKGIRVLVTGSKAERALVERVEKQATDKVKDLPIHAYVGENSDEGLSDFIGLMSLARVVVAPSTGPLHIANALGKKTVSFYPPVRVQSVMRWGPYATDESRHTTLVPDAICGQDFKCIGSKCFFYFCMERLSVDEAVQSVVHHLESEKT